MSLCFWVSLWYHEIYEEYLIPIISCFESFVFLKKRLKDPSKPKADRVESLDQKFCFGYTSWNIKAMDDDDGDQTCSVCFK